MIEYFFYSILWVCVSLLCVDCINEKYENKEEWYESEWFIKTGVVVIMPILYLAVRLKEAFEK
jgi:hypothetical protein